MNTQAAMNRSVIRTLVVSTATVMLFAGAGFARASTPSVALAEEPTGSGVVQDTCAKAVLDVKLFVHAAGRTPVFGSEQDSLCVSSQKAHEVKSAAAVPTSVVPVNPISPNPLQEKS